MFANEEEDCSRENRCERHTLIGVPIRYSSLSYFDEKYRLFALLKIYLTYPDIIIKNKSNPSP